TMSGFLCQFFMLFFFFFSSRRRHTRFSRDWSSDVCSSDLARARVPLPARRLGLGDQSPSRECAPHRPRGHGRSQRLLLFWTGDEIGRGRVGKECRSRWSAYRAEKRRRRKKGRIGEENKRED